MINVGTRWFAAVDRETGHQNDLLGILSNQRVHQRSNYQRNYFFCISFKRDEENQAINDYVIFYIRLI